MEYAEEPRPGCYPILARMGTKEWFKGVLQYPASADIREGIMATIVTGGTGFVGSNIVRRLASQGHDVVSIDVIEPDDLVRTYLEPYAVSWVHGDILDKATLDRAARARGITKIVHAAVYTAVREDIERAESRRIVEINVMGTANMLELARELSVQRFVYVSSGGVYEGLDSADNALREDAAVRPTQLYNVTKHTSEVITLRYGELHGFETAAVRLGGPYGPMERVTGHRAVMSLIHLWTGKAVRGETIEAISEGHWDFTYVSDIASGIQTVLDAPSLPHRVYNLSKGVPVTASELVAAFREAHPSVSFADPGVDGSRLPPTASPPTASRSRVQDSSRIREDLGFETRFDLVSGLKEYISWRRLSGYLD